MEISSRKEILRKFGGIKSQRLATIPRHDGSERAPDLVLVADGEVHVIGKVRRILRGL